MRDLDSQIIPIDEFVRITIGLLRTKVVAQINRVTEAEFSEFSDVPSKTRGRGTQYRRMSVAYEGIPATRIVTFQNSSGFENDNTH